MPLRVVVVKRYELQDVLRRYRERGYVCIRGGEEADWECARPINEIMVDVHIIIVKEGG